MKEQWKQVPGYERYLVSNTGRVISTLRNRSRELKPQTDAIGYQHYRLYPEEPIHGFYSNNRGLKPRLFKAHKLVLDTFSPNLDTTLEVNHLNADKKDNRLENLEWVTRSQNIQHSWDLGLRDEHHGRLSRRHRKATVAIKDGTERYFESRIHAHFALGCSRSIISKVLKNGKTVLRGPAKGYTFITIPELPIGERFEVVENYAERIKIYNAKYFNKKKVV